jgi:hypothetical protein
MPRQLADRLPEYRRLRAGARAGWLSRQTWSRGEKRFEMRSRPSTGMLSRSVALSRAHAPRTEGISMTDVIEMIKADHRALEAVFVKLEAEEGDTAALLEQVKELLVPHSKAEETVVYPAIKSAVPAEGSDVDDGIAEHHHVASVLGRVMGEDRDDPGADGLVAAIIGEVRHHVEEEENDILPKFANVATTEQLHELGERFAVAKERVLAGLKASS